MMIKIACTSDAVDWQTCTVIAQRIFYELKSVPFCLRKYSLNYGLIFSICWVPVCHLFGRCLVADLSLYFQASSVFTNSILLLWSRSLLPVCRNALIYHVLMGDSIEVSLEETGTLKRTKRKNSSVHQNKLLMAVSQSSWKWAFLPH